MIRLFNKRKNKIELPDYWLNYAALFQGNVDYKAPIDNFRYVVFDIESTGLNIKKDRILSIGALSIIGNEIDINSSIELYIEQEVLNYGTIPIHGIVNSSGKAISELDAVKTFVEYIGSSVLVGHNVSFDISIINQVLKKTYNVTLRNKILDTFNLYHRISKGERATKSQSSLDSLCKTYNIPASDRHTALGDSYITAVLFMKLVHRLKKRGVETLNELLKDRTKIL